MVQYLFAYRQPSEFTARIDDFATPVTTWDDEVLYKLTVDRNDDEYNDWMRDLVNDTELIARQRRVVDYPDKRMFFEDLRPDSPVHDIVKRETPGGDIRKYTNDIYGGVDITISCKLFRTLDKQITGFEPLSMESAEELIDLGICHEDWDETHRYPSAGRILRWADIVDDEFGLDCGGMGNLHFGSDEVDGGFNGFVIYEADEEVKEWAEEQWSSDPDDPFMRPSEFDFYDCSDYGISADSVLRMWWD